MSRAQRRALRSPGMGCALSPKRCEGGGAHAPGAVEVGGEVRKRLDRRPRRKEGGTMTLGRRALMAAGYRLIMVVVICTPGSLRADDPVEVLIDHHAVKPALLRIAIDRTILFVNRSGKPIDVTFLGYRGMHHVSESSGQLTVVFHHAGRHPYIATFGDSDESHLHGLVEVDASPSHGREPPVCTGLIVRDTCISP